MQHTADLLYAVRVLSAEILIDYINAIKSAVAVWAAPIVIAFWDVFSFKGRTQAFLMKSEATIDCIAKEDIVVVRCVVIATHTASDLLHSEVR